ncbi:GNAT family N-acetyltransferase [Streptomyces sp. NRRL WC-3742]|uniref:GNAT family N-acetyltransferase n=1 Tax=Streptomyces sp. NRRL WC-3742 TaxID=1463934 RepID=UPI0004C50E4A|nr:GNAT family N-acetyltransferase [Streptomyces sp. NRRL WC-3742]
MIDLRTLTPADAPLWHDLRVAALTDAPQAFRASLADWHDGGAQRWRARLDDPRAHQVAAFLAPSQGASALLDGQRLPDAAPDGAAPDGAAVGLAAGMPGPAPEVRELRSLWVAPRARGRGVADLLIAEVERWAREDGATTLHLGVLPANEPALALYRRHGFTPLAERAGELVLAKPLRPVHA